MMILGGIGDAHTKKGRRCTIIMVMEALFQKNKFSSWNTTQIQLDSNILIIIILINKTYLFKCERFQSNCIAINEVRSKKNREINI